MISVHNLKKSFIQGDKKIDVLQGINITFEQNKSYAITGVSGTGKSTFLHIISGIDAPTEGKVLYENKELSPKLLNKEIGLVFQFPYLIKELSVLENVILKDLINNKDIIQSKEKGIKLLKKFNLEHKAQVQPSTLSGGEQQRISILRAIFNQPKFLIADEPTGNLDENTGKYIVDLLIKCKEEWNMGLIISSHSTYLAQRMEKVFTLRNGLLFEDTL